jgi:membrane-bound metal-dependent hydrolase YbcI (DUF457 family)
MIPGMPADHPAARGRADDSRKRVLVGLALALAIGFIPAAYYSFGISGAEVRRIRARQAQLSDQPGDKPITDEFDSLEAAVTRVRHRGLTHTAVLWVLVSGIAGAAIYRVSGRNQG